MSIFPEGPICHHELVGDLAESKSLSLSTAAAADDLVAAEGGLGAVSSCWLSLSLSVCLRMKTRT